MTRLPWEHGHAHRTHEDDGAESLNADVMRFVAILALCLVALFALVRSIPLAAPIPPEQAVRAEAPSTPPAPGRDHVTSPVEAEQQPPSASEERSLPAAPDTVAPARSRAERPASEPPAMPLATEEGFSLRFDSDEGLQRLIADGRVRVYARPEGGRWWKTSSSRLPQFEPAAAPVRLYQMTPSTVPRAMLESLGRDRGLTVSGPVLWGVSLPPDIEVRIRQLVAGRRGGQLVITAGGAVTFDQRS